MALCVQTETVYIPMTNSATPRYQMDIVRKDWAGSDTNCAGWLLLTQTEFQDMKTSGVQITSAAEAEPIASALLLLLAIAFGVKAIRRIIEDSGGSDERH